MKLYYTGTKSGGLQYSLDGGSTYIDVTLAELKTGISLSESQNYNKIKLKVGSKVFENLDTFKDIMLVNTPKVINLLLVPREGATNELIVENVKYTITEETEESLSEVGLHYGFINTSTGEIKNSLLGNEDDGSDYSYCIYQHKEDGSNELIIKLYPVGDLPAPTEEDFDGYFDTDPEQTIGYYGYILGTNDSDDLVNAEVSDAEVLAQITTPGAFKEYTIVGNDPTTNGENTTNGMFTYEIKDREQDCVGYQFSAYAYPANLGDLTQYVDALGTHEISSLYKKTTVTINGTLYNVYISNSGIYMEKSDEQLQVGFIK